jgi:hypothetical protein
MNSAASFLSKCINNTPYFKSKDAAQEVLSSVAKLIAPDWGDKVDSNKGLAGWYDNPMSESTVSPIQGL